MAEGVFWDQYAKEWRVRIELGPDEAENVAHALGLQDAGARDLLRLATEARANQEAQDG